MLSFIALLSSVATLQVFPPSQAYDQLLAQRDRNEMSEGDFRKIEKFDASEDTDKAMRKFQEYPLLKLLPTDLKAEYFFDGFQEKILRPYEAGGSEAQWAAATIKWRDSFVAIQPYTFACFLGCYQYKYTNPPLELRLDVDGESFTLRKKDPETLLYYLPLAARLALAKSPEAVKVSGFTMKIIYDLTPEVIASLSEILDTDTEIAEELVGTDNCSPTLKEKLLDLKDLLDSKLVTPLEYGQMRTKLLESGL